MKKLFGLKDVNGKDVILNLVEENNSLFFIEPLEKEPEFKVGQWGAFITELTGSEYIFFIDHYKGDTVYGKYGHSEETIPINKCFKKDLVFVTPQEIETHLRKICDEKYIGKKVKCMMDENIYIPYIFDSYSKVDTLWYFDNEKNTICKVYGQGKFAEIISDKKKLPKTKEEYAKFLADYWLWNNEPSSAGKSPLAFLDEYEDNN